MTAESWLGLMFCICRRMDGQRRQCCRAIVEVALAVGGGTDRLMILRRHLGVLDV